MNPKTVKLYITESTRRPGRLSMRLKLGDSTVLPLVQALADAGFKPGDEVEITAAETKPAP